MPCFPYSCLIISMNSKQAKLKTEARGTLHFWSSLINIGPACCPGQLNLSDVYCSGYLRQGEERGQLTCVNIASPVAAARAVRPRHQLSRRYCAVTRPPAARGHSTFTPALLEGNFKSTTTQFNSKFAAQLGQGNQANSETKRELGAGGCRTPAYIHQSPPKYYWHIHSTDCALGDICQNMYAEIKLFWYS